MKTTLQSIYSQFSFSRRALALGMIGVIFLATHGQANTLIWNGGGSPNFNWNNSANWFGATPANGDTLVFQGGTGLNNTNNIAGLTLNTIRFNDGGFALKGNAFTLTNSILCTNTVGTNTIAANITLATADVQLVVSNGTSVSLFMSNAISGSVGVVKSGTGNLYYRAPSANTYTGTTLIRNGLFIFYSGNIDAAFGGPLTVGDGSGTAATAQMMLAGDNIPDSVPITVNLGGTLDLNAFNETIGLLTLSGGTVTTGAGTLTLSSNVTTLASSTISTISGNLSLGSASRIFSVASGAANPDLTISAIISGAVGVGFTKTGSGNLSLTAANTYSGPTTNNLGFIILNNDSALGANGSAANGTVVNANSYLLVNGVNVGNEFLTLAGNCDYRSSGASSWAGPVTFNGVANINVFGSTFTNTGAFSGPGGFTKGQTGTLRIGPSSGTNSYTGDTTVASGVLELNGPNVIRFGTLTIGDGIGGINADVVRYVFGSGIFGGPGGSTVVIKSTGLLDLNGFSDDVGPIAMDGSANITTGAGLFTLFQPLSTYDSSGTNTTSPTISGNFNLNSASTLALTNTLFMNATVSSSSTYTLTKTGPGSLYLNSSNSYSGLTVIQQGLLLAGNPFSLGTTNSGTVVSNGASLVLDGSTSITNESLTLNGPGPGGIGGYGSLDVESGIHTWAGPITNNVNGTLDSFNAGSELHISGPISGPGGLELFANITGGTIFFEGATANTYGGLTKVDANCTLRLGKPGGVTAIPGNLVIDGYVYSVNGEVIADTCDMTIDPAGTYELSSGHYENIDGLSGSGSVLMDSASYIGVGYNNGSSTFSGTIVGPGNPAYVLYKSGSGTFTFNGTGTYTNPTYISAGTLLVNGNLQTSPIQVASGALLGGSGTVGTIAASGTVSPGNSPGTLASSNVTFAASGKLIAELTGPTAGTGYDQLNVTGTNTLANATLTVVPAFTTPVAIGQQFTIINNDLADAITGTFLGLPNGATITAGVYKFTISYFGGTGNDVVLTLTSIPGAVAGSVVTAGDGSHGIDPNGCNNLALVITNTSGSAMTGVNATLSTTTPGVIITQPYSPYPNIPASGKGTNLAPFQISTLPSFVCGTTINLQLSVDSSLGSFTMNSTVTSGESAVPSRFDNNIVTNCPDIGSIDSTNLVASWSGGAITKVAVSLWLVAPFSSDMTLSLIAPDGTTVPLVSGTGAGANFGSGSADGSRTTFDDSAATAITAGASPFVGTFRPQGSLASFNGIGTINGPWHLHIVDGFGGGSPDTLRNWSLFLSGTACATGSGSCDYCLTSITGSITNTDLLLTNRIARTGVGTGASCGAPKAFPGFSSGTYHYDLYTFTNTSASDACVTVLLNGSGDIQAGVYLNGFDPANIATNYVADSGSSTAFGPESCSAEIPAGAKFFVEVNEITPGGGSTNYTLQLSGLPCPPPSLTIQPASTNTARISWPTWAGGYLLEANPSLLLTNWTSVTNEPIVSALRYNVTNTTVTPTNRFYRLKKP